MTKREYTREEWEEHKMHFFCQTIEETPEQRAVRYARRIVALELEVERNRVMTDREYTREEYIGQLEREILRFSATQFAGFHRGCSCSLCMRLYEVARKIKERQDDES